MKKVLVFLIILLSVGAAGYYYLEVYDKDEVDDELGLEEALIIVSNDDLYGLVDLNGEIVVPLKHDSINYCGSYYISEDDDSFTIYNELGEVRLSMDGGIIPSFYYMFGCPIDYSPMDESILLPYETSADLYGYVDFSGEKVIPTQFQAALYFNEFGLALVVVDGLYGFIGTDGEFVIEPIYTSSFLFSDDGLVYVEKDDLYGYLDTEGNVVIDFIYDSAEMFDNGYAVVKQSSEYLLIDTEGNIIIEAGYDNIQGSSWMAILAGVEFYPLNEGYPDSSIYSVSKYDENSDGWGCIDIEGDLETEFIFDRAFTFTDKLKAIVIKDGLYGLLDESGNEVLDMEFDKLEWLDDEKMYLEAAKYGQSAIYDYFGNMLLGFDYDSVNNFYEGVFTFENELLYGLSDMEGNVIIEPYYDYIGELKNGLRQVEKNGLYGYINNEGEAIINLKYEDASDFYPTGLAPVKLGDSWGFIDIEGNIIIPIIYDFVDPR